MTPANRVTDIEGYKIDQGWLYILGHNAYPNHYKVGITTNLKTRLNSYNNHLPYTDVYLIAISAKLRNARAAEDMVVKAMTDLRLAKREWFADLDKLMAEAERAELVWML